MALRTTGASAGASGAGVMIGMLHHRGADPLTGGLRAVHGARLPGRHGSRCSGASSRPGRSRLGHVGEDGRQDGDELRI